MKEIVCILSYTHQSKHMTAPLAQLWKENQLRGKIITNYGRIKKPLGICFESNSHFQIHLSHIFLKSILFQNEPILQENHQKKYINL